ncbi:protein DMP6-like [Diospyros lotus]|uniref:protein DMP6-like n=1 Tax=Diospyros lotus TaxID=55363 RepID=UPI00225A8565|nr:protein DMP6-like [Diospyros lotus]
MEKAASLLDDNSPIEAGEKTLMQKAMSRTFHSTSHLANYLPTGTVLAFQILSPLVTNQGECSSLRRGLAATLIALCALSGILLSFTDSFKDKKGHVCHGIATPHGLWVIDGSAVLPPKVAEKYRLRLIDFVHALMSILVFATVVMFDQSFVKCFCPTASDMMKQILAVLPVVIGAICSSLFVIFPTRRHGIGFPITSG